MNTRSQMMLDNNKKQLIQLRDSSSAYQPGPKEFYYCIMPSESRKAVIPLR